MSFLEKLFSSGATKLVDSVGSVLDNVITSKEEKLQLANELAKAEMQFQLDVQKMNNEEKAMVLGDIQNARQREVQMQTSETATKLSKNVSPLLALGTVVIVLALFYVLVFSPSTVKGDSKDIVMYILGVLSAVLTQIYSYYFGSSAGSQAKDRTISDMKS
jgi:citrate synthase